MAEKQTKMSAAEKNVKVVLAQPRGFCAGVERAIDIVERALEKYGAPVYVRHEIVHNKYVVETLRARGAIFVEEIDEIPTGAVTVFSAHGVAKKVENGALVRELDVIDATCPLEPEDVAGHNVADDERVAFVTQTTLSVNDTKDVIASLKQRFPNIVGPDTRDICYATQNRQTAVIAMAKQVDLLLVVGAHNSSNSNRLREIGENFGIPSYLIENAAMFDPAWLDGVATIGLTAGASAPETLVQETIERLKNYCGVTVEKLDGVEENVHFKLPRELADVPRPKDAMEAWGTANA